MKSIQDLEKYIDNALSYFLNRMEDLRSETIDMGKWIQYFAFGMFQTVQRGSSCTKFSTDVIGEVTFSKSFGLMDVGDQDGSLSTIKNAIASASWLGHALWLYWLGRSTCPVSRSRFLSISL